MKRKLLFVIPVAALCALFALTAPNARAATPAEEPHCVCCGTLESDPNHTCEDVEWLPFEAYATAERDGYYYLTGDFFTDLTYSPASGKIFALDLNGHTFTYTGNSRVFSTYSKTGGKLIITDSVGTGKIVRTKGYSSQGAFVWLTGTGNALELYRGTLDANGNAYTGRGVIVDISSGSNNSARIYGGTIIGGTTTGNGGAVGIVSGTLLLQGGTIQGGSAALGGAVYVGGGTVNVAGTQITGGDLYLPDGKKLTVSADLHLSQPIALTMAVPGVFAENLTADVSGCFTSTDTDYAVRYKDQCLSLQNIAWHCVCCGTLENDPDHICEEVHWEPFEANATADRDVYYYLTEDVSTGTTYSPAPGKIFALDLNGFTYTYTGTGRVFSTLNKTGSKLIITDSVGTGRIVRTQSNGTNQGGIVWVRADNSAFELYGGTLDTSNISCTANGVAIDISTGANTAMRMYGGTIIGGTTTNNGGAVRILASSGTLLLRGGTIQDGSAAKGSAVYVGSGTVNVAGTQITGGDLYLESGKKLTVSGDLNLSHPIALTMKDPGVFAENLTADVSGCFTSTDGDYTVKYETGTLSLMKENRHCVCCGTLENDPNHECVDVEWQPFEANATPDRDGYYYLTGDVSTGTTYSPAPGKIFALDLNGFTYTYTGTSRVFDTFDKDIAITDSTLIITDSADTGKIVRLRSNGTNQGGFVWLTGTNNAFELYGGTLDASNVSCTAPGVVVDISSGTASTMRMYGGTVIGGRTTNDGGAISLRKEDGKLSILGGTVKNGSAGAFDSAGKITGGYGGNIYVMGGELTVKNATVKDGYAAKFGGNISVSYTSTSGEATLTDSDIIGGVALRSAGNVFYSCSYTGENPAYSCQIILDGCRISGGTAKSRDNVMINAGSDSPYVKAILRGNLRVDDPYKNQAKNMWVHANAKLDISGLGADAHVGIRYEYEGCVLEGFAYGEKNQNVYYDNLSRTETVENASDGVGQLYFRPAYYSVADTSSDGKTWYGTHYHCSCCGLDPSHAHSDIAFTPWDGTTVPTESGNYYLTRDYSKSSMYTISNGAQIHICLDGHTCENTAGRLLELRNGTDLTVSDCVGTGALLAKGLNGKGGVIFMTNDDGKPTASLHLYGVTVGRTDTASRMAVTYGGLINTNGTLELLNCTLQNGYVTNWGRQLLISKGGELILRGKNTFAVSETSGEADIYTGDNCRISISGTVNFTGGSEDNLRFGKQNTVQFQNLASDQPLGITVSEPGKLAAADASSANLLLGRNAELYYENGEVFAPTAFVCTGENITGHYTTVAESANHCPAGSYVKLNWNVSETITCDRDLYLDTNGHILDGAINLGDHKLYGMDSRTDDYTGNKAGAVISRINGEVLSNFRSSVMGKAKRYVAIQDPDSIYYSFHRFYVGLTAMSLRPEDVSVGFKGVVAGDEAVMAYLAENDAVGYRVWIPGNESLAQSRSVTADTVANEITGGKYNVPALWIENIMLEGDDSRNSIAGDTRVCGSVYINLNGEPVEVTSSFTLRGMLEKANSLYDTPSDPYDADAKSALLGLYNRFQAYMEGWNLDKVRDYAG